ncbi:glycoside hydrolase family 73 protein [Lactobacillus psittaci]|uniref:N-acetylmuramidase n=1 Tax=Lactobacillus psittaci DSM 15354 TaxID=1122152 RepID=A0A0R1S291_9LACO|nr:glycoside hydrolase family 73 protein [Lactobacillus psittaci]KRL62670.1 N-acetylmuramidase [Lactobacillus psittaci DSM 15354]
MARSKSRISKNTLILIKVFGVLLILVVGFVCFKYYRRQALNSELIRQEQLAREQEAAKELKIKTDFIKMIGPIAQKADQGFALLPSITIAQACLESNYGQSDLSQKYNNLFGVKSSDPNTSKVLSTKEYVNGKWIVVKARFQVYDSYEASIQAHARLFQEGTSWNKDQYAHVLAAKDYKSQAKALVTDGYATDPDYATKLINLIEQFNLNRFDN